MIQKIRRDKKGVSPVIGVILMVAATIVIAAVVIAMLGGFGPPRTNYMVTATATERIIAGVPSIDIIYNGGPDAGQVDCITATIDGKDPTPSWTTPPTSWDTVTIDNIPPGEGTAVTTGDGGAGDTADATGGPNNNHVIVTGWFMDGTSQVILDTWV